MGSPLLALALLLPVPLAPPDDCPPRPALAEAPPPAVEPSLGTGVVVSAVLGGAAGAYVGYALADPGPCLHDCGGAAEGVADLGHGLGTVAGAVVGASVSGLITWLATR